MSLFATETRNETKGTHKMKFPTLAEVTRALRCANDDCEADADVRLQVTEGGWWEIHTGDPCYDTDHRGHWGSDALPGRQVGFAETKWARDMARNLLHQVKDSYAEQQDAERWDAARRA